ncbi:thiamine-phosphate kinase [Edaphobacter bradus]|uniref:thiamine-phosphate kinase n=1 Tax=Edaphobacter bradus TaxID=2259016 RepID=UPI0021E06500|nr:thiamine-phosphate kinase [Edaphobacter bradus]
MRKTPSKPLGELALIDRIRHGSTRRATRSVALGIGDDCAILRPPAGNEILVTTDLSLEGRHFLRDRHPPESAGHRCLARGLSDLAAMGATPLAAFLSLALPATMLSTKRSLDWVDRFFAGLYHLASLHNAPLAGGDTSESPSGLILADILLIGSAPRGRSLRRSGARAGDALYVTGSLGGASAELANLLVRRSPYRSVNNLDGHPHLFPAPRLAVGQALLRRSLATAAIDLSDGLSTDLAHLCESSKLRAEIEQAALPIHPLARKLSREQALHAALHGGEDYELLFAAPPDQRIPRIISGVSITRIGTLKPRRTGQPEITLIEPSGRRSRLQPGGWEHFSASGKTTG